MGKSLQTRTVHHQTPIVQSLSADAGANATSTGTIVETFGKFGSELHILGSTDLAQLLL